MKTQQHSQLIIKCAMMLLTGVLVLGDRYFVSADNLFHREPTTTFVVFKLDAALKIKLIDQLISVKSSEIIIFICLYRDSVKVDAAQRLEKEFLPFGVAVNKVVNGQVLFRLLL